MSWIQKLLGWGKRMAPAAAGDQPAFSFDETTQEGTLHLRGGPWAGRTLSVDLSCCEDPTCGCAVVYLACTEDDGSFSLPVFELTLDTIGRTVEPDDPEDANEESKAFAKAVHAELDADAWVRLHHYLVERKREAVRTMDVTKLTPPSPEDITDDGKMVFYSHVFPFAEPFALELNGERWMVDDQYCVQMDCDCTDVVLDFLRVGRPLDPDARERHQVSCLRYNYSTHRTETLGAPAEGHPPAGALFQALQAGHHGFDLELTLRHKQMKVLYGMAVNAALRGDVDSLSRLGDWPGPVGTAGRRQRKRKRKLAQKARRRNRR